MKIRVAAPDAESAGRLAQQLVGIADAAAIQSDGVWTEVSVTPGIRGDRIIGRVLHAVEHWLDAADLDSATVHLGDRSYAIARNGASATQAVG